MSVFIAWVREHSLYCEGPVAYEIEARTHAEAVEKARARFAGTFEASTLEVDEDPVRVNFDYPPIPVRTLDYSAVRDSYEPPMPIGHGRTAQEAVADLLIEEELRS